jgi:hypothetical protein
MDWFIGIKSSERIWRRCDIRAQFPARDVLHGPNGARSCDGSENATRRSEGSE